MAYIFIVLGSIAVGFFAWAGFPIALEHHDTMNITVRIAMVCLAAWSSGVAFGLACAGRPAKVEASSKKAQA